MSARPRILIVDDETAVRFGLRDFFDSGGYDVSEAETCRQAEEVFRATTPDVAVLDYSLPDGNALDLLRALKSMDMNVPIVILTAHGSIDLAVRAIKEGAEQFLTKPVELSALLLVIQRLLENRRNRQRQVANSRSARPLPEPFLGRSTAIRSLAEEARRLAGSGSTALIQGETGVGKGVLAKWLHQNGPRAAEPFVDLNCAGLGRELLESELFGHERGAFTGAATSKPGLLEIAHGGTLFLDEIGDMDIQIQAKLLKVLEERRFRHLGEVRERRTDLRLLAATHQDLGSLMRSGRFRSDLYFRISTIPLRVPSLRERIEDIPVLAEHLLRVLTADVGRGPMELASDAVAALEAYAWPGNIRELRNVLERAVLLSEGRTLVRRSLRFEFGGAPDPLAGTAELTLQELERRHIERILGEEQGHVERAARRLGIPRSTLYQKLKALRPGASRF